MLAEKINFDSEIDEISSIVQSTKISKLEEILFDSANDNNYFDIDFNPIEYSVLFELGAPSIDINEMYVDEDSLPEFNAKTDRASLLRKSFNSVYLIDASAQNKVVNGSKEYNISKKMVNKIAEIGRRYMVCGIREFWFFKSRERKLRDLFRRVMDPLHKGYRRVVDQCYDNGWTYMDCTA